MRARRLLLATVTAVSGIGSVAPTSAHAQTQVPSTTYTGSGNYWTVAGSPYIINGNVTVASGATLTIEPGVVVKMNGTTRTIFVNGSLRALGNAANHVVFTSIQDDSIAGDSGGDGPTTGAPGQWYMIRVSGANQISRFTYVDVRFGAFGSANWSYGAIHVTGSSSTAHIQNSLLTQNQRSGLLVTSGGTAVVGDSEISYNANGISVNQSVVSVRGDSSIHNNSSDGVWFNLTSTYTGAESVITRSDISANGGDGIDFGASTTLADSFMPRGNWNNIYANSGAQLKSPDRRFSVDWKNNFWGSNVYFHTNSGVCDGQGYDSDGHLAFSPPSGDPPVGPISFSYYLVGATKCAYDRVRIYSGEFETSYIDNSAYATGGIYAGEFSTAYYSFTDSLCTEITDPVSIVFYGNAYDDVLINMNPTLTHIGAHAGWGEPNSEGGEQYFYAADFCGVYGEQLADPTSDASDRYHIRLSLAALGDPLYGSAVVGTPHHEDWIWACPVLPNHAVDKGGGDTGLVSGFVQGREQLESTMGGGHHPWYAEYIGNTDTFIQCDGDPAGSDGYVDFMYVP